MKPYDPNLSPTESIMRHYHVPMTRENYLILGGFEGEPDAEQEAEIPVQFRLCYTCSCYPCRCAIPGVAGFDCECEPCTARRNE
jgi:hypothetical protein